MLGIILTFTRNQYYSFNTIIEIRPVPIIKFKHVDRSDKDE